MEIKESIGRVMVGKEGVIQLLLTYILAGGHVFTMRIENGELNE